MEPGTTPSNGTQSEMSCGSSWADMVPDVLANIFCRLSLEQLLLVIPCVCKPWKRASQDPLCWEIIDLHTYSLCRLLSKSHRLMMMLVERSCGRLREFTFPFLKRDDCFELLTRSAPLLQKLHIPNSYTEDGWAIRTAPLMLHITDLDVSMCHNGFSYVALEAFGKHCMHVTKLRRNTFYCIDSLPNIANDFEAFAIAKHYPHLKHLELGNNRLSPKGLRAILDNCPMLEYLDVSECRNLETMNEGLVKECKTRLKVFLEPQSKEAYDYGYFDEYFYDEDDVGYMEDSLLDYIYEDTDVSGEFYDHDECDSLLNSCMGHADEVEEPEPSEDLDDDDNCDEDFNDEDDVEECLEDNLADDMDDDENCDEDFYDDDNCDEDFYDEDDVAECLEDNLVDDMDDDADVLDELYDHNECDSLANSCTGHVDEVEEFESSEDLDDGEYCDEDFHDESDVEEYMEDNLVGDMDGATDVLDEFYDQDECDSQEGCCSENTDEAEDFESSEDM